MPKLCLFSCKVACRKQQHIAAHSSASDDCEVSLRPRERAGSVVSPLPVHYRPRVQTANVRCSQFTVFLTAHFRPRPFALLRFSCLSKASASVARVDIIEFERLAGRKVQEQGSRTSRPWCKRKLVALVHWTKKRRSSGRKESSSCC